MVCFEYFFGIPALGILSEKLGCLVIPPCLRRGEHTAKKRGFQKVRNFRGFEDQKKEKMIFLKKEKVIIRTIESELTSQCR